MTLFFYLLIGLITFFAFLHAYNRKEFDVSRTIVINKGKHEVFSYVRQLRKQHLWAPWFKKDPETTIKYKGDDGYEGAVLYWKGNRQVGEGTQEIVKINEGKLMEMKIFFVHPIKTLAMGYIAVKEIAPGKTKIVWGLRGNYKFPSSVITIFYSSEKFLGTDLEQGLKDLKQILEN